MQEFSKLEEISYCYTKGNQKNIRWLKKNFPKVKYVDSLMPIFMDTKISSVIIATPIKSHYSLSLSALKHGKNVFVEKPLGTTLRQCTSLIKVAKKQNLKLFVGHIFLYHPVFIRRRPNTYICTCTYTCTCSSCCPSLALGDKTGDTRYPELLANEAADPLFYSGKLRARMADECIKAMEVRCDGI